MQKWSKRWISIVVLLAAVTLLICMSACAKKPSDPLDFSHPEKTGQRDGEWQYSIFSDKRAVITGYTGGNEEVTVPATIGDGYRVLGIGELAFYNDQTLRSVTVSEGTEVIMENAFSECGSLAAVHLPSTLKTIGAHAFELCTGLLSIEIPDSVETIGDGAFNNCMALQKVTLGANLKTIGAMAFYECYDLGEIRVGEQVTSIGDRAFQACVAMTEITLPASLQTIGEQIFYGIPELIIYTDEGSAAAQYAEKNAYTWKPFGQTASDSTT